MEGGRCGIWGGGLVVDSRETVCYAIKVFDIRYKEASFGISDKGGLCRRFWDIEDNKCSDEDAWK